MVDLSLHILDVASNAFKANAKIVKVKIEITKDFIEVMIEDDGCGMDDETLKSVVDPFFTSRTTRKVGLGIPLFIQTCEQTGGFVNIESKVNVGTKIIARMYTNHVDAIPLGNIAETIFVLSINPYNVDVVVEVKDTTKDLEDFLISTKDIKDVLEDVPLSDPSIMAWIKEYIQEGLAPYKFD